MKTSHWVWLLVLLLFAFVVLPIAAYVAGGAMAGPYSGPRGLASYLQHIYADAASGRPLALALLFGPVLAALVWPFFIWLIGRSWPVNTSS